ncbi:hypothetical protein O181_116229 [Austropuccinia psidii MF-1]|uniref:Uncharacterized protein n=1 Tax=Austropuccinia psidii MF-1 TaxID=1389203 RepID=A0A9Q3PWB9_9BASI|nr:hypothetical protein [Austropuccinia psidii MF-1]
MPPMPPSHRPNPQCRLPSLRSCSALKLTLRCRHPISALTTPHAPAPPPHPLCIQSLCSCGALKICLQCHPNPSLLLLQPA